MYKPGSPFFPSCTYLFLRECVFYKKYIERHPIFDFLKVVELVHVGVMVASFVVGPFHFEIVRCWVGVVVKTIVEVEMSIVVSFVMYTINRRLEVDGVEHENAIDGYSITASFMFAVHSLFLSRMLQPGFDFSILIVFLDIGLHMSFDEALNRKATICISCIYALLLISLGNGLEHVDFRRRHAGQGGGNVVDGGQTIGGRDVVDGGQPIGGGDVVVGGQSIGGGDVVAGAQETGGENVVEDRRYHLRPMLSQSICRLLI